MKRDAQLWAALLAGPTVWFLSLLTNFALAPWVCSRGSNFPVFMVTLLALAIIVAAGLISWKLWRDVGIETPGESGGTIARDRSLALAGVLLNGMFVLVTVAQAIPNILLKACE
jgi:hypothetical protein